VVGSVTAS